MSALRMPKADPTVEPVPDLVVTFADKVPTPAKGDPCWESKYRGYYNDQAKAFVDALVAHAPGGLVDAIFAHLCARKASLFRVTA